MTGSAQTVDTVRTLGESYKYGFVTDIESEQAPPGLNEGTIRFISAKKREPQWMLDCAARSVPPLAQDGEPGLGASCASRRSTTRPRPTTPRPRPSRSSSRWTRSIPSCCETYEKLGIPLGERAALAGVAVDAVFDSVSVATTFKAKLAELGIIFCSFGEAVREHPELVRKYLGSVVPSGDNFFAALNSAVFSDGSFAYVPPGVRCPMELSTYFRINAANSGQFERTLIIADKGSYVSYLEGCTAPQRDENQLHAAVVELVALDDAEIKYSTVQNWYPGDEQGRGGIYNFVTKRGACRGARSQDLLDPGRDRLRHHLEISKLHPGRRQFGRRVLLDRHHQQPAAGRYRDQDDPYRAQHALDHHLQGHLGRARPEHLSRPRARPARRRRRAQLHPMRFAADRRPLRRAHRALYRGAQPFRAGRARGDRPRRSATTSCSIASSAGSRARTRCRSSSTASARKF